MPLKILSGVLVLPQPFFYGIEAYLSWYFHRICK